MINFSISSDTVLSVKDKVIDFKNNINKVLETKELLIVHVFDSIDKKGCIKMSEQPINSVYAVTNNGDILWNIKDIIKNDELYTGINLDEEGKLIVFTFEGIAHKIDVCAQKVISRYVAK